MVRNILIILILTFSWIIIYYFFFLIRKLLTFLILIYPFELKINRWRKKLEMEEYINELSLNGFIKNRSKINERIKYLDLLISEFLKSGYEKESNFFVKLFFDKSYYNMTLKSINRKYYVELLDKYYTLVSIYDEDPQKREVATNKFRNHPEIESSLKEKVLEHSVLD